MIEMKMSTATPDDLLLAVRGLYGAMERFDAAAADRLGVDRTGLRAINAMEAGAVGPGALGAALGLSSGSVTALLDRLERGGHVARTLAAEDGRRRNASLTPETRMAAKRHYGRLGEAIREAFGDVDQERLSLLVEGLDTLARAFADTAAVTAADEAGTPRRGRG